MTKFKRDYRITLRDMTKNCLVKTTTILHDFQECFAEFCLEPHLTGYDLNEKGLMWVVTDIKIEMLDKMPLWNENLTIELWFSEVKKLRAYMDFKVFSNGRPIAQGDSCWLILDKETRHPVRIEEFINQFGVVEEVVFDSHGTKMKIDTETCKKISEISFNVNYTDIDYNGHVNNISYIDWAIASLPIECIKNYKIKKYSVCFKHECFINEKIKTEIYKDNNNMFLVEIIKEDGTTACEINVLAENNG